jgi:hypothetical protein
LNESVAEGGSYSVERYNYLVRVKTSVTLPDDLLQEIDKAGSNRSGFLEVAANQRDQRDAEILNAHADRLNREALDVLGYQDLV